ncbi:MAG: response regulator [Candidatus Nitrosopolaris sp.]
MDPSYYDLVITDIKMPTLNGLELYQRVRAININIKVLFVSAIDAEEILAGVYGVRRNNIIRFYRKGKISPSRKIINNNNFPTR